MTELIRITKSGLYCEPGDFYIDPWPTASSPVACSFITHAHADHARPYSKKYIATPETCAVMRARMGESLNLIPLSYGQEMIVNGVRVSLHPAGHVLGSAQVRVEYEGEVWVASGDYKRDYDPTCKPFEIVKCDVFITEATFALPIYRWRPTPETAQQIADWWQNNTAHGKSSVLFCYAFGKAQRLLAELEQYCEQPVLLHGAMEPLTQLYRNLGVKLPPTLRVSELTKGIDLSGSLALAPPSAAGTSWMRRFGKHGSAFASGWMRVRGNRRRRGYDRGFVVSDHADWPSLIQTINDTGASRVLATHGKTDVLVRYLREQGIDASALKTEYGEIEGA